MKPVGASAPVPSPPGQVPPGGTDTAVAFGRRLRFLRTTTGLSQQQLADLSSLSIRTVRELEAGRIGRPRRDTLRLICQALHLSPAVEDSFRQLATSAHGLGVEVGDHRDAGASTQAQAARPDRIGTAGHRARARHDVPGTLVDLWSRTGDPVVRLSQNLAERTGEHRYLDAAGLIGFVRQAAARGMGRPLLLIVHGQPADDGDPRPAAIAEALRRWPGPCVVTSSR